MITLYWCPYTRASRIHWLLEELGAPFQVVTANVREPASITDPDFRRASPMGKVPAIRDGAVVLADSTAIALYLADTYRDAGLAPDIGDRQRAPYLYWMVYTCGAIEPALAERATGAKPNRASHGWGDYDLMIATLENGLRPGPWLLGDRFSAADVLVGSALAFMRAIDALPSSAVLADYTNRCVDRPGYRAAMAAETDAG